MSTSTTTAPLVALITAGSAGLGAATARLFAREGIRVAINYGANAERADKLVDELSAISPDHLSAPNDFVAIRADLADRTAVRELVDETARRFGRLDVVFSNGGWTRPRDYANLDDNVEEEDWDRCFNMNVKSHLFLMHAAKPHLDAAHGVFITTASLAGVSATGSSLAYSVTKAAQIHLVKGLAHSAGPNIRVNSVSPGLMLTEWGLKAFSAERQNEIRERSRLKRLPEADDVAHQVLCFVRSQTTTGINVVIDGGLFA